MMYKYNPRGISSKVLTFTTPDGNVILSEHPVNISDNQLEYLQTNYPEFVECLKQNIIESVGKPETTQPASSPKRKQ